MTLSELLSALVERHTPAPAHVWLASARTAACDEKRLPAVFTDAFRRLAGTPVQPTPAEAGTLAAAGYPAAAGAGPTALGRALLLVEATSALPSERHVPVLTRLFRSGDTGERTALLRALPCLPAPERYASLAAEACRSSVQDVFEAVATANPFAAAHLPAAAFDQMVLKAVFLGVPLAGVVGLASRLTPGLARMATDFRSERQAAGRPVPADLDLLLATGTRSS
ncbi:MAG TPA: EboA domain-containing protein [Azospirillum sp.]|nr:EboA domain-containing protein [Azospirillum sp.]